ncbi:ThiF family adenylyltransferase [Pseudoxanthomonas koreensis]|uniref:ThiF family adenylyltransferase n=1 Tax=Pseudoxanthomonas koreensis TaxID=266061 RepID=UPI0035A6B10B
MTQFDADAMHRLAKLALDAGEVATPEAALALFQQYRLRIHLGEGWANTLAGQACVLTAVSTASRALLGGVEVTGDLTPVIQVPLFAGRPAADVVAALGGTVMAAPTARLPSLLIGDGAPPEGATLALRPSWDGWWAQVAPADSAGHLTVGDDNPLAGVCAGALAVSEVFSHVRGDSPEAGYRRIGVSLWNPLAIEDWHAPENRGPALAYLPTDLWLIGLGHLGQAYAWGLAMLPYPAQRRPRLVLQDVDRVTESNLSTCMLVGADDFKGRKTRVMTRRLEAIGFEIDLVERRFGAQHRLQPGEPTAALFGVDNVAARRDLDTAAFALVVEVGLGSGYRDFRNLRLHTLPGPRPATELWPAQAASQSSTELNTAYQQLARDSGDLCGVTILASKAVATPFVGAFAAGLALAELVRPLHGGGVHASLDCPLRSLTHRLGEPTPANAHCAFIALP